MGPILQTKGLVKRYGGLTATNDVSLRVMPNSFHAIIGPNGAGKTTLMALLTGEVKPDEGAIELDGRDITALPTYMRVARGIGRSFQITRVFGELTVRDNIALAWQRHLAGKFNMWRNALSYAELNVKVTQTLEKIGLTGRAMTITADMSHGEKRALEIGMALSGDPKVLLLDEPMAGMGHEDSAAVVSLLRGLRGTTTIVMVEHDMDAVFALAESLSVLVYGRLIASGTPQEIKQDAEVRRAYLGEEHV